jgi:hypothetical protein
MLTKKILGVIILTLSSVPAYAMFCPGNYNQINMGDSIAQVTSACGAPSSQSSADSSEEQPQEWTYYVKSQPTDQSTLRMTVAFVKGVVTNMSVNGIGLTNTQICNGNTTQVGDTEKSVKQTCGAPAFINQSNTPASKEDITKVTKYIYNSPTGNVELTFENGKLTGRS